MASVLGTKRASERSMEKCDGCRVKRVKCLPTSRDWTKGERCYPCETRDQACGPNRRAPKAPRKAVPNVRPTDRVLAPSSPPGSLPLAPPPALDDSYLHKMPALNNCPTHSRVASSVVSDSSPNLLPTVPEQAAPTCEALLSSPKNDTIKSGFITLGDLRMTLQNVNDRLHKTSSNIPQSSHSSSDAKAETALEFIAFCIRDRYSTEIQKIIAFTEGLESSRAESVLRRALDAIDHFLAIVQTPVPSELTHCKTILNSQAKILDRLVLFYEVIGDFPEAERLLAKLSALSSKYNVSTDPGISSRLAESLTRTSRRMHHVLIDLGIPEKYTNSLHFPDSGPFPPIHRALLDENELVARHLCESSQEIHKQVDILGRQPVHIIAECSNLGFLDLIHSKDRNILHTSDISRRTPLCIAAYIGDHALFENLFSAGADVESRDEEGRSVLCVACGAGHLSIVQFLLNKKISPNDGGFQDCSPLHAAASAGHLEVCRALLNAGAWTDWYMHKPPIQAAKENDHFDVVSLIGEFAGRSENSWSLSVDSPALDESSTYPLTSEPRPALRHTDRVHSPPPTQTILAGSTSNHRTVPADEALDASYEIVDC